MKTTIIFFLTFISISCFGQDTIYFDAKWNPTIKANADFFRIDKKESGKYTRTDYFKTNQIQMRGTYSSLSPEIKEGCFEWYHSNGKQDGGWLFFDEDGKLESTKLFKIDHEIKEAKMFLKLPNDEWFLAKHSDEELIIQYVFKRNEIIDPSGRSIVPAIMLYVENAKEFEQDVVLYSAQKRLAFLKIDIKVEKILIPSSQEFPISYKNAILMKTNYSNNGFEHVLYMVYIITKDNKGVQLYMDMTKDIAAEYEKEFLTTLQSIKELE
jgi:hypothetical protein